MPPDRDRAGDEDMPFSSDIGVIQSPIPRRVLWSRLSPQYLGDLAEQIRGRSPDPVLTSFHDLLIHDGDREMVSPPSDGDVSPTADVSPVPSCSSASSSSSQGEFDDAQWQNEWSQYQDRFAEHARAFWTNDDPFYQDTDSDALVAYSISFNTNNTATHSNDAAFNSNSNGGGASSDIYFDIGLLSINDGSQAQETTPEPPTEPAPIPTSSTRPIRRRRRSKKNRRPSDGGELMRALAAHNWRQQRDEEEATRLREDAQELADEMRLRDKILEVTAKTTMAFPLQRGEDLGMAGGDFRVRDDFDLRMHAFIGFRQERARFVHAQFEDLNL